VRSEEEYRSALKLIESGINDCEVGRRLGIPRGTVQDWRVGLAAGGLGRTKNSTGQRLGRECPRCGHGSLDGEAYSYLLGIYLGDGCISTHARDVYRLRVFCDEKYPFIINDVARRIATVRGTDAVGFAQQAGCVEVSSCWKHWPCLFPQHGRGRKHERKIQLVSWQQRIVEAHPSALIRGLIHSDGNRHVNRVTRRLSSGTKEYRYTRYMFTNASTDIVGIFTDALDRLGVHWTQTMPRIIAVSRREDVAFLDRFVGPKN
jgi:hypothetical protein